MRRFISAVFVLALSGATAHAGLFSQFVVFGDSLSDTGNAYLGSGGALPAPPLYTALPGGLGRFTDGPDTSPAGTLGGIWHEVLAGLMGEPVATPFLIGGTNYAIGGAQVLADVPTPFGTIPSLSSQVGLYLSTAPGNMADPNALYIFWGGANDLYTALESGESAAQIASTETNMVASLGADIGTLAALGAKNFLWLNLPQLATTPRGRADLVGASPSVAAAFTNASTNFAADITSETAVLETLLGVKIADVDIYGLYQNIINNPAAFGYTNVTDPAQGLNVNPDQYLFWDLASHPTTTGHILIAEAADAAINGTFVPEPATLAGAGAVLLLLAWHRRAAVSGK
jgi:outer membrane lipase/esterase